MKSADRTEAQDAAAETTRYTSSQGEAPFIEEDTHAGETVRSELFESPTIDRKLGNRCFTNRSELQYAGTSSQAPKANPVGSADVDGETVHKPGQFWRYAELSIK